MKRIYYLILMCVFAISCQPSGRQPVEMEELTGEISQESQIFLSIISEKITSPLTLRTYQLRDCESICSTDTLYVYLSLEQEKELTYLTKEEDKELRDIQCVISAPNSVEWRQEVRYPNRIHPKKSTILLQFH